MAIFSTRSSKRDADEAPTRNVPIDSIETLRTRARQRLIGATVLVALGIITFALLFDSQPRPIPVDIPIVMPDKDKPDTTATNTAPAPVASASPAAQAVVETPTTAASTAPVTPALAATTATAAVQAAASLSAKEEIVPAKSDKKPEAKVEAKPVAKAEVKPETKQEAKQEPKPTKPAASDEAAKALAILEGKEPPKAVAAKPAETKSNDAVARFVVQVGAFAENEKAREVRLRVERTGLKTYVHVAETPQGKRIRVRVGPFPTRAEAEKAAAKIKTLDLPAAILTL
jgi:DedD protein